MAKPPVPWMPCRGAPPVALFSTPEHPMAQSFDPSVMETATLGPWRRTVEHVRKLSENQQDGASCSDSEGEATSSCDGDQDAPEMGTSVAGGSRSSTAPPDRRTSSSCWDPDLMRWAVPRIGKPSTVLLVVSFGLLEAWKSVLVERAYVEGVNTFSLIVATDVVSLLVALQVSLMVEGPAAFELLMRLQPLGRFMGISFLFTFATALTLLAYRIGTPPAEVVTVGYIYLPSSAFISYYVFRRRYGTLEWLSMGMMSLAIMAFVSLREELREGAGWRLGFSMSGFGLVAAAVGISVSASVLAERAFKEQLSDRMRQLASERPPRTPFYIMKAHLDFASLFFSVCLWLTPSVMPHFFNDFFEQWSHSKDAFGGWGRDQTLMVLVAATHGWVAGLVTREFSTVVKSIVQTLVLVLVMLFGDPLMGNRFHFRAREAPSIILAVILLMSAAIFQTGRINLAVLRQAANLDAEAHPELQMPALAEPEEGPRNALPLSSRSRLRKESRDLLQKEHRTKEWRETPPSTSRPHTSGWVLITTYALILIYILFDAGRTLVLQNALQAAVINSTSMGLVCYMCGAGIASALSAYTHGFRDGFLRAWSPWKICRCLPAAFLFALASALGNMSFAHGINSALYVVLGKVYTPVAALGARWVMGKYYMWLEWFALLILTLASVVFGYLQGFDIATGTPSGAPLPAMVLVVCSATSSALASLVTEKILKGEDVPFHLQKVRLDVGSIISSLALLPVLGCVASRAQDIPWLDRPIDRQTCPAASVCWDLQQGGCSNEACACSCASGVFAGWHSPVLLLAVGINTAQGWLVGKVTKDFSVIHRAIADSFSLLTIYFIGDPIFNHTSLGNIGLNLVAFIVPLSTATFSVGSHEMQKVFDAATLLRGREGDKAGYTFESESTDFNWHSRTASLDTVHPSSHSGCVPHSAQEPWPCGAWPSSPRSQRQPSGPLADSYPCPTQRLSGEGPGPAGPL